MKIKGFIFPIILIFFSGGIAVTFSMVAFEREFTELENLFVQFVILIIGLLGSFLLGVQKEKDKAYELVRRPAKSAFRRMESLMRGVLSVEVIVKQIRGANLAECRVAFAQIEGVVSQQINSAADALEDWKDLAPDEVNEVKKRKV